MIRAVTALALSLILVSGCATPPGAVQAPVTSDSASASFAPLASLLADAPEAIRFALHQEWHRTNRLPLARPVDGTTTLITLVAQAESPVLQPDDQFEQVLAVVRGIDVPVRLAYAEALSGYLTATDFPCSQPVFTRYFQDRFGTAAPSPTCPRQIPFSLLTRYGESKLVLVDPARVQDIHLLFAGNSDSLASRFGHVALRLVVCPEFVPRGQSCDAFLRDHLVLGFRANVDELSLSLWKGLTGGYQAHLYASGFMDVYQEYAIDEFREVYSLPLQLTVEQRTQMVRELSELHWRFAGPYQFINRNCGTLLQDVLRMLWPEFASHPALQSTRWRPDWFFQNLGTTDIVRAESLASLEAAEREGYFFPSTKPYYEKAVAVVSNAMQDPGFSSLEEFLAIPPPVRQLRREADAGFLQRLRVDTYLRDAQLMLEEYAMSRSERRIITAMGHYLHDAQILPQMTALQQSLAPEHWTLLDECLLKPISNRATPTRGTDGIPLQLTQQPTATSHELCTSPDSVARLRETMARFIDRDADDFQHVQELFDYYSASIDNVLALKLL